MEEDDLEELRRLREMRAQRQGSSASTSADPYASLPLSFGSSSSKKRRTPMLSAPVPSPAVAAAISSAALAAATSAHRRKVIGPQRSAGKIGPQRARTSISPPKPDALPRNSNEGGSSFIGPAPPNKRARAQDDDGAAAVGRPKQEEEEKEEEEEEERGAWSSSLSSSSPAYESFCAEVPISHEVELRGHTRAVTALSFDHAGSRLVSGGADYTLRLWDFGGMDAGFRSFREVEACDGHKVVQLAYSSSGGQFLCAPGSAQVKLYDREGRELREFMKGDPYLADLRHTKGHTAAVTAVQWDPQEREQLLTGSADGSLRLWNVEQERACLEVIKTRDARLKRTGVTAAAFSSDGKLMAAACLDGSLQVFAKGRAYSRPRLHAKRAHQVGSETSSVLFVGGDAQLVSRGGDDTLKVWDVRRLASPLCVFDDLPNIYGQTDVEVSPDGNMLVTGTSVRRTASTSGLLCFFDLRTLQRRHHIGVGAPGTSVVRVRWHPTINQLAVGASDSHVHLFYDPQLSRRGALLSVVRKRRVRSDMDFMSISEGQAYAPNALPLFREQPGRPTRRQFARDRMDPVKTRRPEPPVRGPGHKGRIGDSVQQSMMKDLTRKTIKDQDPREAILSYAKEAAENPMYVSHAYARTQPITIFAEEEEEEESDDGK
jgi:WD repeat-containing protein 70